ncbi:MAG TPA: peptidylprolyl isomerase [Cellvibrio sp.]|nr:peptidylprolyl isomerase [Cellvibrio sp.]
MLNRLLRITFVFCFFAVTDLQASDNQLVAFKTDFGVFVVETYPETAPETVKNFLMYVDTRFYDDTIFHRIIPGFLVQGGGISSNFVEKPTQKPVINESTNGLKNEYKSIAMAREPNPNSATAQFYVNLKSNPEFNATQKKPGYTVFGRVIAGIEVLERIAQSPRGRLKALPESPNYVIRILSASRINATELHTLLEPQNTPSPSRFKDALVPAQ